MYQVLAASYCRLGQSQRSVVSSRFEWTYVFVRFIDIAIIILLVTALFGASSWRR